MTSKITDSNIKEVSGGRTRGDGMEHIETSQIDNTSNVFSEPAIANDASTGKSKEAENNESSTVAIPGAFSIYRANDELRKTVKLPAKMPQGKLFYLVPHLIDTNRTFTLKNKEPRFVPFEPYKAAVSPLVLPKRQKKPKVNNRNNLDLNVLVSHVSNLSTNEMNSQNVHETLTEFESIQRREYEKQLAELRKERDYFESQLKFQVQVNTELKNLLVAAVGEDLQTRVNVLTEDKLQLARALLNSAHNLSTHTEQIEYLAGQSEVWRSKFLASSLMVEELARWKASLSQKNKLLLESNKQMLQTVSQLREMQVNTLKNLKFLAQVKTLNLPSANALDITAECQNISENLVLHSGIGMPENVNLHGLETMTDAEKLSIEALQNVNQSLIQTDDAFRAIVGQAFPSNKTTTETQTTGE